MFKRNDWVVGVFSIILGGFAIYRSTIWHAQSSLDPSGPGGVPMILGWGILIIGVIHLIGSIIAIKRSTKEEEKPVEDMEQAMSVVKITILSIIYIIVIRYIGYLIATPLLIAGIMWVVKVRDIKSLVITSILSTIILFFVFYIGLQVKLPMGFLKAFL